MRQGAGQLCAGLGLALGCGGSACAPTRVVARGLRHQGWPAGLLVATVGLARLPPPPIVRWPPRPRPCPAGSPLARRVWLIWALSTWIWQLVPVVERRWTSSPWWCGGEERTKVHRVVACSCGRRGLIWGFGRRIWLPGGVVWRRQVGSSGPSGVYIGACASGSGALQRLLLGIAGGRCGGAARGVVAAGPGPWA